MLDCHLRLFLVAVVDTPLPILVFSPWRGLDLASRFLGWHRGPPQTPSPPPLHILVCIFHVVQPRSSRSNVCPTPSFFPRQRFDYCCCHPHCHTYMLFLESLPHSPTYPLSPPLSSSPSLLCTTFANKLCLDLPCRRILAAAPLSNKPSFHRIQLHVVPVIGAAIMVPSGDHAHDTLSCHSHPCSHCCCGRGRRPCHRAGDGDPVQPGATVAYTCTLFPSALLARLFLALD